MPLDLKNQSYLPYKIVHEHYIQKKFMQNLLDLVHRYKTNPTQSTDAMRDSFDQVHALLDQDRTYLTYCATTLPENNEAEFKQAIATILRNQELDLIAVLLNWRKYPHQLKDIFKDYWHWDTPNWKVNEQPETYLLSYMKLAQTCQHQYQNALKTAQR